MTKCDCCKEQVKQVGEDRLCFSCDLVREFVNYIEDQTELCADLALELASDLVELVRSRILERGMDAPKEEWAAFFDDVGVGMVRLEAGH